MTGKLLAAAAGSIAGYVVYQRQQTPTPKIATAEDLVVAAPLANIAASALAAIVSRSAMAGFVVGFALSAVGGNRLDELVAQRLFPGSETPHLTEAA